MRIVFLSIIIALFVSCSSKQNYNALFTAIEKNDTTALNHMITSDINLNTPHPIHDLSPICFAIESDAMDAAKLLANQGAVINGITPDQNPLFMAVNYREVDFAQVLIEKGIDIFMADENGNQPIHMAAKLKDKKILELLLLKGAKINARNNNEYTPLDFALISNRKSTIELIKELGGETYYKVLPSTSEGPFFEYSDKSTTGYYIKHSAENAKTYIVDTTFNSNEKIVNGWDGDKSIYDISNKEKPTCHFSNVTKILAIGDIHGQYQRLEENLKSNGVIDNDLNWTYGNAHLVFVGDIFDRGDQVTECLWLIRKLEVQAEKSNGMVHYLLGNHESMVLKNDLRYLAPKYYSLSYNSEIAFEKMYNQNTFMGQWLRNKNVIIKINDVLFAHAGISQKLSDTNYSIQEINNHVTDILYSKSKLEPENIKLLMSSNGPIWYRGYFKNDTLNVKSIISNYDANHIVVGHTEVDTLKFVDNKPVIGINIPLWNEKVPNQALLIQNGKFYRVINGVKKEQINISEE